MNISETGIQFIKSWESFRGNAYYDQAGIPTIGYGTIIYPDGQRVRIGDTIDEARATACLEWDCRTVEAELNRLPITTLRQNQFDALASFCYNVGVGGFRDSTLRHKIVAQEPVVEDYFVRWNKVTDPRTGKLMVSEGLTRRRKAEFLLWSTGVNA
jgi:lysozyme